MLIVVKIGTNSVIGNITKIVKDVYNLKKSGANVILVSSGAVGMGRNLIDLGKSIEEKQVLASLGQVELMKQYKDEFQAYNLLVGQILISKKDIMGKAEMKNITNMLNKMLLIGNIIPVINENDTVALEELMFTDNDEIAGLLATKFKANMLIILTNVDGVYDNYNSIDRQILPSLSLKNILNITHNTSSGGRGGMFSKVNVAKKMMKNKIPTVICNVAEVNILERIVVNKEKIGTIFLV